MEGISLLLTMIRRESEPDYLAFFQNSGTGPVYSVLCQGTAGQKLLNLLGLEKSEKTLLYTMLPSSLARRLMQGMVSVMGINVPGNGIALSVPVSSVGGESCLKRLMPHQNNEGNEEKHMERSTPYDLIIAIAQRGSSELVMDAARQAGAGGGTIVHAKGTGGDYAEKFFGVSIAAEKEMVLIVTRREQKAAIMRAIMDKAGAKSEAHTALFSLPVEDVAGLRSVMTPQEEAGTP